MESRGTHPARRFRLTEGPVHRIQQPESFHGSVVEILLVNLERHHPPGVYIPKIHRRMPVDYPLGQHLACPTR